jgi:phosphoglucosamine mutase
MEVIMASKKTLSELCAPFKVYPQVLKNVRVKDKEAAEADADVKAAVEEVVNQLGDSGRILVRQSGTEPLVRVMVEAKDKETCDKYVNYVVDVINKKGHAAE